MSGWTTALLVATGAHAGFQATVTGLVYPALARVRTEDFPAAHDAHSRRITPLVAVVYGAAVVTSAGATWQSPGSAGIRVAALGTAGAVLVTATVAAPTHGRLGRGRTPQLVARLLAADRVRLGCALVALGGAVAAALSRAPCPRTASSGPGTRR